MPKKSDSDRLYRIGEAARALDLQTCVLRFWEDEFPQLTPVRTPKGQRLYREEDMAMLRRIRALLHEKGMTIAGARRVLAGGAMPKGVRPRQAAVSDVASCPPESVAVGKTDTLLLEAVRELENVRLLLSASAERRPA